MRRQLATLAAAACLTTAACATTDPTPTPTPTDTTTIVLETIPPESTAVASSETASTAPVSPEPSVAQTSSLESETPGTAGGTQSADAGATGRDVDLADHTFAVTPQQAIDQGKEAAGGGIVHSIELDWSRYHDAWVYELDILVGNIDHDIDIQADTGDILDHDRDDTDDTEKAIDLTSPMTWENARDKAQNAVQGRITSWKLEWDDNRTSYEFDIEDSSGDEIEVSIDANTGRVEIDD